jgi:hypothetical protein
MLEVGRLFAGGGGVLGGVLESGAGVFEVAAELVVQVGELLELSLPARRVGVAVGGIASHRGRERGKGGDDCCDDLTRALEGIADPVFNI